MRSLVALLILVAASCGGSALAPSPTRAPSPLAIVDLKYRILDQVGRPWYCDPDFYPIARADEKELARQRWPEIAKDQEVFVAILRHNGIDPGVAYSIGDELLLAIYRDWKDLQRLSLDPTGPQGVYGFVEVVRPASSAKQGERVEGRVDAAGRVSVLTRSAAGPPNCPICLPPTTRIDTPQGLVPVADLHRGDLVWTLGTTGERIAVPILATGSIEAPVGHEVVRITLGDGRTVTASPGHPTADGRPVGSLAVGDVLDGAPIVAIDRLPYRGRTYDLLPAGPTGAYWAGGVLLGSTLHDRSRRSGALEHH